MWIVKLARLAGQSIMIVQEEDAMYITTLIMSVPEEKQGAYREWAEMSAGIFKRYGCLEIIEAWEDFVPRGKNTDFFRAVDAKEGEKIVISWQIWKDRDTFFAAEDKMHKDDALETSIEPPFDNARLITGCFEPVYTMGR